MTLRMWLAQPLPREVAAAIERLAQSEDVAHVAIMPDVHLAEDVCIGTVVATRSRLFPAAVGGDIGCGMAAVRFGADARIDERQAARLLAGLYRAVPTVRHAHKQDLPAALTDRRLSDPSLDRLAARDGAVEFATLGRGNHFIEFQRDAENRLWLMLHSGSRAMGQAIRDFHLRRAWRGGGPSFLDADSEDGRAYLGDLQWALAYADESRRAMVGAIAGIVAQVLGASAEESSFISCHHNHVGAEEHLGERLWVHRKGAIRAREGEPGIVPGSMGTESYLVEGRGVAESLCSTSHGAGRAMSRSEARRRITVRAFEGELRGVYYDHRLGERLRDEAPSAYKDVRAVLRAEAELTRIERVLRPVLSYKGA